MFEGWKPGVLRHSSAGQMRCLSSQGVTGPDAAPELILYGGCFGERTLRSVLRNALGSKTEPPNKPQLEPREILEQKR